MERTDHGDSWLSFMREKGKEREREAETEKEVKNDNIISSLLKWMVTPLTEADNTEKKESWRKMMTLVLGLWSQGGLRASQRKYPQGVVVKLWTWEHGQGQMKRLEVISTGL